MRVLLTTSSNGMGEADPAQWARAIDAFFETPLDRRRQAVSRLADRYSWDRVVAPLVDALAAAGCRA